MKKQINIEGMTCDHCVGRITKALSGIEGVSDVQVSLDEKRALVSTTDNVMEEQLRGAVEVTGYTVSGIEEVS